MTLPKRRHHLLMTISVPACQKKKPLEKRSQHDAHEQRPWPLKIQMKLLRSRNVNVGLAANLAPNPFQQRNRKRRHQICLTDHHAVNEHRIVLNAKSLMSNLKQECVISAPTS